MKVINAKVRWYEEDDNSPALELLVDKIPDTSDMVFEKKGRSYYAELNGYVRFFASTMGGYGYGGRKFYLKMSDGSVAVLKGPDSSSDTAMNTNGFGPCLNVSIIDSPAAFERGYTFFAGAVTLEAAQEAAGFAGVELAEVQSKYGISYEIYDTRTTCQQCNQYDHSRSVKKGEPCRYCRTGKERVKNFASESLKRITLGDSKQQLGVM